MSSVSVSSISPLSGYVLVEPAEVQSQTASGIYIASDNQEKPQYGTVIAVGDDVVIDGATVKAPVKKGQTVVFKKWGGTEFKVADTEYQFLKFEDLLAIVK
ncbi:MAG: co-chaperone GroES [Candidatus Pacebacteria bacterium]|nr:co-chaperone GroES [Candidatus Paceibacterota bacterium]PIR63701.1 MAG: co-chaperone GroES [Candidatus Pacebacteria bacterium CG10_big_fil_rev_8_21_14_0_10_40_26]PIZ79704.1 MAG: co-chaperone GroES [Candidatus Pacebacteria bacterium CG_4_10_14_0_2_um_filter_40_20]PJA68348.1 MAG: co-chaperone GroES [Candidatus Pacebacteria bacterium CG_4_9_14_3_um_filter_40_12]PJC41210.1 MAG: co-chaperone GroES [Candidatus Pacebacteria bacterium CG_4_9_14_0_2_um_filter_40_15]